MDFIVLLREREMLGLWEVHDIEYTKDGICYRTINPDEHVIIQTTQLRENAQQLIEQLYWLRCLAGSIHQPPQTEPKKQTTLIQKIQAFFGKKDMGPRETLMLSIEEKDILISFLEDGTLKYYLQDDIEERVLHPGHRPVLDVLRQNLVEGASELFARMHEQMKAGKGRPKAPLY